MLNQGFSRKAAKAIVDEVKDSVEVGLRLEYALKILPEYNRKNPIQNRQGFLRKAILEDWRKNDIKSKNKMNISDASKVKNQMKLNNLTAKRKKFSNRLTMLTPLCKKQVFHSLTCRVMKNLLAQIGLNPFQKKWRKITYLKVL